MRYTSGMRTGLLVGCLALLLWPSQGWGARQTNGTNQSLQTGSAIDFSQATKLTISMFMWWDTFANDDDLAMEYSANASLGGANDARFFLDPNHSGSTAFFIALYGNTGLNDAFFTRPSAGAWHHYLINFDIADASDNEILNVYVDGSLQTLTRGTKSNNTIGGFGSQTMFVMARNNASNWGAGRISEVAFWTGVNLSGTDATNLNSGVSPTTIQSGNLLYYWKVCGTVSPETPTTGAINLTVTGATQVAHPSNASGSCDSFRSFMFMGVGP